MTPTWTKDAIFYHIYPLGLCGAPQTNDLHQPPVHRLDNLIPWLDHIKDLGANALYLGPVFQSSRHGYDTIDYYQVDRRLGNNDTLSRFVDAAHHRGIRVILDAVFNHVGRQFWAFEDVRRHRENSDYCGWFKGLRFEGRSPAGDPFQYDSWQGHYSLVNLNLDHPHVRAHLLDAVGMWMERFGIDGLRLDAADCLDQDFLRALRDFTKARRPDFWLMGEVVHGDYRQWANPETLDTVTNYETYKGLYSSLIEGNYHEVAYALSRQFGPEGLYRDLWLYNFVDNHDVDRVASKLRDPGLLYPLYLLLFTMPGIPSIYYGSEWGIKGQKQGWSDAPLRPALDLNHIRTAGPQPDLLWDIQRLAGLRHLYPSLRLGDYRQVLVTPRQFAFQRQTEQETIVIALNSDQKTARVDLNMSQQAGLLVDVLNSNERYEINDGQVQISLPGKWGRVLLVD